MHNLNPYLAAFMGFAALFGSSLLGLVVRRRLPDHHLSAETKDAVRVGMASVATMAALVLGLLVATTKQSYDAERDGVVQMASRVVYLDHLLHNCGPGAADSRAVLRVAVRSAILRLWPEAALGPDAAAPAETWAEALPMAIQRIPTSDDSQRAFKAQAAALANTLGQLRWLVYERVESSIPVPLLIITVFWLAVTFLSVGLFAPPNATVVAAQLFATLSVAGALFLILQLDQPFSGLIKISSRPMLDALHQLTK